MDNIFHVYLMRGFQKYAINWILTMAFWATCKIAQPIQPIWQHIFALPWSALKKPPWEFNIFHIFGIPSSSRHEKCCQILPNIFLGYFNTLETHSVLLFDNFHNFFFFFRFSYRVAILDLLIGTNRVIQWRTMLWKKEFTSFENLWHTKWLKWSHNVFMFAPFQPRQLSTR